MAQLSLRERLSADIARTPTWCWDAVAALMVLALALAGGASAVPNDWTYYDDGQRLLFGTDGLHLYAHHPIVQIGPVGLSFAWLIAALPGSGQVWAVIATSLVLAPALALVRRIVESCTGCEVPTRAHVIGWLLVGLGWFPLVVIGQVGDALALLGALCSVVLLLDRRPALSGVLLAVGVAAKPWTLVLVPLLLFTDRRSRARALLAALLVGCVTWAPFLLVDRRTLAAGRPTFYVPEDAWQRLVGVGDFAPPWWRAAQLLVCWLVGLAIWTRARRIGRLDVGVVAAGGAISLVRVITDLGVWPYYVSAALPLILAAELVTRPRRIPWATVATFLTLTNGAAVVGAVGASAFRMVCLCSALAVLCAAWMEVTRADPSWACRAAGVPGPSPR